MIKSIYLNAFKTFNYANIDFGKLTVLTGLNGSGKSTIIQAIRMVSHAINDMPCYLKGYGGYEELRSKYSLMGSDITVSVLNEEGRFFNLVLNKSKIKMDGDINKKCYPNFEYISADRLGPCTSLPIMGVNDRKIQIGEKGEYSADFFKKFESVLVDENLRHLDTKSNKLSFQLSQWMGEISPGVKLDFSVEKKHDLSHVEINEHRATNTGFGISYCLPIILASLVLSSKETLSGFEYQHIEEWFNHNLQNTPILLIENPEAHLHPRGQTAMGTLLAKVASCGVQVIVETHSDHFIDGVRLAVKNEEIVKSEDVAIYYFKSTKETETEIEKILIKENGKLDKWPEGFFDQTMINLRMLSK